MIRMRWLALGLLCATASVAGAQAKPDSAKGPVKKVVHNVHKAVDRGATDTRKATVKGAKDATVATVKGAQDARAATVKAAKNTGKAVAKGAKDTGKFAKKLVQKDTTKRP